jgi:hypothetical protein
MWLRTIGHLYVAIAWTEILLISYDLSNEGWLNLKLGNIR